MKRILMAIALCLVCAMTVVAQKTIQDHVLSKDRHCKIICNDNGYYLVSKDLNTGETVEILLAGDEYGYNFVIGDLYSWLVNTAQSRDYIQVMKENAVVTIWKQDSKTFYVSYGDAKFINEYLQSGVNKNTCNGMPAICRCSVNVIRKACDKTNI